MEVSALASKPSSEIKWYKMQFAEMFRILRSFCMKTDYVVQKHASILGIALVTKGGWRRLKFNISFWKFHHVNCFFFFLTEWSFSYEKGFFCTLSWFCPSTFQNLAIHVSTVRCQYEESWCCASVPTSPRNFTRSDSTWQTERQRERKGEIENRERKARGQRRYKGRE